MGPVVLVPISCQYCRFADRYLAVFLAAHDLADHCFLRVLEIRLHSLLGSFQILIILSWITLGFGVDQVVVINRSVDKVLPILSVIIVAWDALSVLFFLDQSWRVHWLFVELSDILRFEIGISFSFDNSGLLSLQVRLIVGLKCVSLVVWMILSIIKSP